MATGQLSGVIQHLRRAMLLRDGARMTDGQLLEDYISRRDQAALAALVQRHGPMVWGRVPPYPPQLPRRRRRFSSQLPRPRPQGGVDFLKEGRIRGQREFPVKPDKGTA